jgi:hypothetical protein
MTMWCIAFQDNKSGHAETSQHATPEAAESHVAEMLRKRGVPRAQVMCLIEDGHGTVVDTSYRTFTVRIYPL